MDYIPVIIFFSYQIFTSFLSNKKLTIKKNIFENKNLKSIYYFLFISLTSTLTSNLVGYYINFKLSNYYKNLEMQFHKKITEKTHDSIVKTFHLQDTNDLISSYVGSIKTYINQVKHIICIILNIIMPFIWIIINSNYKFIFILIIQYTLSLTNYKISELIKTQNEILRKSSLKLSKTNRLMTAEYQFNTSFSESFINIISKNNECIRVERMKKERLWLYFYILVGLQNTFTVCIGIIFTYKMNPVVAMLIFNQISNITVSINTIIQMLPNFQSNLSKMKNTLEELNNMETKINIPFLGNNMNYIYITNAEYNKTIINDLKIEKNNFIFLIGHPGIGKTKLFSLLTSSTNEVNGNVLIDGVQYDIKVLRDYSRIVHQKKEIMSIDGSLIQVLTGFSNLNNDNVKKLREIIHLFSDFPVFQKIINRLKKDNTDILYSKFPLGLSGGEMAFMNIIYNLMMILLHEKIRLVFFDEIDAPFNGKLSYQVFKLIKESKLLSNVTVFIISHHSEMFLLSDKWIEFSNYNQPIIHNKSWDIDISKKLKDKKFLKTLNSNPTFRSMIIELIKN